MTPQWLDNEFRRYAHISVNQTVPPRLLTLAGRCQGLSEAKKSLVGTEMYKLELDQLELYSNDRRYWIVVVCGGIRD